MNNHIVCRYMKSLGMDPIKVNVLVDKDSPWSPLMGWGMKHQRARNGQFDKRWQPVEKTKDYQLLEGAWGEASSSRIARSYRGIATQWNDGRPIHSARLLVCLSHRPAKLPIGRPVWNIFRSWKILADIVRRDIFFEYSPTLENIGRYCEEAAEHTFELRISLQTSRLECNTTSTPTIKLKETL